MSTPYSVTGAPLGKALSWLAPILFEEGAAGYMGAALVGSETRIDQTSLRILLVAAAFIGVQNCALQRGMDPRRVADDLAKSVYAIDALTRSDADRVLDLVARFRRLGLVRVGHSLDDVLCEALWSPFQAGKYAYPSAMAGAVAYGLNVGHSLRAFDIYHQAQPLAQ